MAHHEDRFCRRRQWSDFIRGSIALTQRPINSFVNLQGDFIPHAEIFYILSVKNLRFWKKSAIDLDSVHSTNNLMFFFPARKAVMSWGGGVRYHTPRCNPPPPDAHGGGSLGSFPSPQSSPRSSSSSSHPPRSLRSPLRPIISSHLRACAIAAAAGGILLTPRRSKRGSSVVRPARHRRDDDVSRTAVRRQRRRRDQPPPRSSSAATTTVEASRAAACRRPRPASRIASGS